MSTTELKRLIDERSEDERRWMASYLEKDRQRAAQPASQMSNDARHRQWLGRLAEHAARASTGKIGGPTTEDILEEIRADSC